MEDFFGCTLVVENLDQVKVAENLVIDNFIIDSRRPKNDEVTHKEPYSFQFDDLRLYLKLKTEDYLPKPAISDIIFEIQIKTFLQHAWAIATHDLIYKSKEISWSKERIAYQIKAMLEQAELVISSVDSLVSKTHVEKENKEILSLKQILNFYLEYFNNEDLPKDLIRLCKNTSDLLKNVNLSIDNLEIIIKSENLNNRGTSIKNLSPYLLVLQSIINYDPSILHKYFSKKSDNRFKILWPSELEKRDIYSLNLNKIIIL